MTKKKAALSQVVPVLTAVLLCDAAVAEPNSGKPNLIGVFDRLYVGSFPTARHLSVYIKLTDAEGAYSLEVRQVQVSSCSTLSKAAMEMHIDDRLSSTDFCLGMPLLQFPQEGLYEFQVWANSIFLGSATLKAIQNQPKLK